MTRELRPVDVTSIPELLKLAEEVGASGESRILRRDNKDLAVLMPVSRARSRTRPPHSKKDLDAFRSAAGSWKDVDIDKFLENSEASRASSRPPVEL
jgi:hypothetical protein